jgi:hypothetical protein
MSVATRTVYVELLDEGSMRGVRSKLLTTATAFSCR